MSGTEIGKNNIFHQGSIIGGKPQDLKYKGEKTKLIIGDNNTIREFCTLNRGTDYLDKTVIGNDCLLMAYVHVAHDCIIQDKVILANGVQLGGHSQILYHATVGGMTPVHQFCKVGIHSFIGGGRVVLQDVPPYILATGDPLQFSGINNVGLRRRNFSQKLRTLIKKIYTIIYRSNYNTKQALEYILSNNDTNPVKVYRASHMNLNTSKKIFSNRIKESIHIVNDQAEADFIISNGRFWTGNPNAKFAKIPDNFTIYKEITTDRVKIVSIFKRKF